MRIVFIRFHYYQYVIKASQINPVALVTTLCCLMKLLGCNLTLC